MRLARVKCPHCGAHDQLPLPLNFVSGWSGYYYCSSCKNPVLFFQIGQSLSSYKLDGAEMSTLTEKAIAWYILEALVELHKVIMNSPDFDQVQETAVNGYNDDDLLVSGEEAEEEDDDLEDHSESEEEDNDDEEDATIYCICDYCDEEVRIPWFEGFILEPPYSLEPTGLVTSCPKCKSAMLMIFPGEDSEFTDKQHLMLDEPELRALDVVDFTQHVRDIVRGKINVPLGTDIRVHIVDLVMPGDSSKDEITEAEFQDWASRELDMLDEPEFWKKQGGS